MVILALVKFHDLKGKIAENLQVLQDVIAVGEILLKSWRLAGILLRTGRGPKFKIRSSTCQKVTKPVVLTIFPRLWHMELKL